MRKEMQCTSCGKTFTYFPIVGKTRKFCSRSCYKESRPQGVDVPCLLCGKTIHVSSSLAEKRKCCSQKHFGIYRRMKDMELSRILQIDGVTFAATPQYDVLMEKSKELHELYMKNTDASSRRKMREDYYKLSLKIAGQLRVVRVKSLEAYRKETSDFPL